MIAPPRQSTPAELDALDSVCDRLAGFGVDLNAEYLDGYLAALAVGPRAVPADEWLAALMGDDFDRVFADPQDRAGAIATLAAREAVLRSQLDGERIDADPDFAHLRPLLLQYEGDDAPPPGSLWSLGFQDALGDFEADWALPADLHEDDRRGFEGLLGAVRAPSMGEAELASYVASVWPQVQAEPPTRDDLIDAMCFAVQDLRLYWADHAPRPATRRVEAAPGRNDPCPCGSGRKYKKCHGAAA